MHYTGVLEYLVANRSNNQMNTAHEWMKGVSEAAVFYIWNLKYHIRSEHYIDRIMAIPAHYYLTSNTLRLPKRFESWETQSTYPNIESSHQ